MPNLFFFRYARSTLRGCDRYNPQTGDRYNLLDLLYNELLDLVHAAAGGRREEIGYRDEFDLAIGDPWPGRLAAAAATARVLVAVVTPSYLESVNCGREFRSFLTRYEHLKAQSAGRMLPAPIIPLFFEDQVHCWPRIPEGAREFFEAAQYSQAGLPRDYPAKGYAKLVELERQPLARQVLYTVRDRICQCKDLGLPPLEGAVDFRNLPSAFEIVARPTAVPDLARGPADPAALPPPRPLPTMGVQL
jgi:hypothetical protein